MSMGEYLRSHVSAIITMLLISLALYVVGSVGGLSRHASILAAALPVAGLVIALLIDRIRCERFMREVRELSRMLERPYQLHSLVSEPTSPDHQIIYEALCRMGIASANEVAQANERVTEQREYMEAWIHEMKAPMAAAGLIAGHTPEPESSQLRRELDRMGRMVDQVLWYARSLSPERDYLIREVPLAQIVRTACRQNARLLIEQGVSVDVAISEDLLVFADEKQMAFVISQAIVNAAKYGSSELSFTAREETGEHGAYNVVLEISDDGWGIPEHDLPRVFDRGFTGTRGREAGSSTGMGLYLAANLCEKLGFGLALTSEEGSGTRVLVSFPFDRRRMASEVGHGPKGDTGVSHA